MLFVISFISRYSIRNNNRKKSSIFHYCIQFMRNPSSRDISHVIQCKLGRLMKHSTTLRWWSHTLRTVKICIECNARWQELSHRRRFIYCNKPLKIPPERIDHFYAVYDDNVVNETGKYRRWFIAATHFEVNWIDSHFRKFEYVISILKFYWSR